MKIITLNTNLSPWSNSLGKRIVKLPEKLTESGAGVIVLQEVYFDRHAKQIISELAKYGFRDFFRSETLLLLSKYKFSNTHAKTFSVSHIHNPFVALAELGNYIYGKGFQSVN